MKIRIKNTTNNTSFRKLKMSYTFLKIALFLLIFLAILVRCQEDDEEKLNPVYGPVQEKQYGEENAFVRELSFNSKDFFIVGDFITPIEGDLHPVIMMIHGSGDATRYGAVPFNPLIEIFLRNGFAVLTWDKPGSGESKGNFSNAITERANIILDAIRVLNENSSIDKSKIGLWGISQAGWVMPKALGKTDEIAFMVVVGGGGEDSIEQFAYQVGQVVACSGGSQEDIENAEKYWSQMSKATTYNEYKEAADILVNIPSVVQYTGFTVTKENNWSARPRDIDAFYDPMDDIELTNIPMLVFYGEKDKNVDPVQGAEAYKSAFGISGNDNYQIEVIEGAGHILTPSETGCIGEFVSNEYVPEYLEILEQWLIEI
jgi:pimeloyl-ACP methyl ester carboxylesterase